MGDKEFYKKSFQIYLAIFKKMPYNLELYDESFWLKATERIQTSIDASEKTILFMKAIYTFDQMAEDILLDLLFNTACFKQRTFNLLIKDPDGLGKQLYWPYEQGILFNVDDLITAERKVKMINELNLAELTRHLNDLPKSDLVAEFPKTYKRLSRYYKES